MPDNIDPFPQHHASKRRGKPTIADIVNDGKPATMMEHM